MVTYDLPQEILVDIFLRLSAKSIGKCRCLSKQLHALLSTPEFIKSHLTRGPHQENLILIDRHSIYTVPFIKEECYCRKLNLPYEGYKVLGSCDGLILLQTQQCKLVLVNPITLLHLEIPEKPEVTNSHLDLEAVENFSMHAFGYDRFNDDYKVVTLSHYEDKEDYFAYHRAFVYVYSVKTGVWKRVGTSPYSSSLSEASCGAFVNDAIHWLVHGKEGGHWLAIAGLNLVDEVFYLVPAPNGLENKEFNYNGFNYTELGLLGGCVCIIDSGSNDFVGNGRIDVWIMKEYGVEESWTKLSIVGDYPELQPLCFFGEFVLLIAAGGLVVYNQREGTLRDLVVKGAPTRLTNGGSFVQSLVSPVLNGT